MRRRCGSQGCDHVVVLRDGRSPILRVAVAEEADALQACLHDAVHGRKLWIARKARDLRVDPLIELCRSKPPRAKGKEEKLPEDTFMPASASRPVVALAIGDAAGVSA